MKTIIIGCCLLMLAVSAAEARIADSTAGKQLFMSRCASCHSIPRDAVGPALKDVDKRRTEAWIINFVHSSQTVIKSGDTAAVRLFESRNKTIMPDHPDLSDDNIRDIIAYVSAESKKPIAEEIAVSADYVPYPGRTSLLHRIIFLDEPGRFLPLTSKDYFVWLSIAAFVIMLVIGLYVAVRAESLLENTRERDMD